LTTSIYKKIYIVLNENSYNQNSFKYSNTNLMFNLYKILNYDV